MSHSGRAIVARQRQCSISRMLQKRPTLATEYGQSVPARSWRALRAWFESPLGRRFYASEVEVLQTFLPRLFGYHLVLVGASTPACPTESARTLWQYTLDPVAVPDWGRGCVAEPEFLPVASDSVDVVVLCHVLEYCESPYQVLREVDRVLIPEGHLVVCGFNPWSLWGLRSMLERGGRAPWCGRFLRTGRLRDWFELLGFETRSIQGVLSSTSGGRFLSGMGLNIPGVADGGGVNLSSAGYVMLSRKRVSTLTPVRRTWRPTRALASARVVEPTPRIRVDE